MQRQLVAGRRISKGASRPRPRLEQTYAARQNTVSRIGFLLLELVSWKQGLDPAAPICARNKSGKGSFSSASAGRDCATDAIGERDRQRPFFVIYVSFGNDNERKARFSKFIQAQTFRDKKGILPARGDGPPRRSQTKKLIPPEPLRTQKPPRAGKR